MTASGAVGAGSPSVVVAHPSAEMYGADRMLLESVRAMADAGWDVVVALPGEGPLVEALGGVRCVVVTLPVPVLRKSLLSPAGIVRFGVDSVRGLTGQMRLLRTSGADVVYVNTVTIPTWVAAARLMRRPVISHVHEAEDTASRAVRKGLSLPLLLSHLVLANSGASRDVVLEDFPSLAGRLRIVYNGFAGPELVVPPREHLSAPVRLVLVGRISPRKGTDTAVEAVRELVAGGADVVLDIVGGVFSGYEWFRDQVREQASAAGIADRLVWRGEVDDPYAVLAEADIALVPSRKEPFGNTAVEALLCERPLVVTAAQGLVEVVRDGADAEVAPPDDPAALAAAVRRLIADWPAARGRAARAAMEARERFSQARYAREIVFALDDVLRMPPRRRGAQRG